LDNTLLRSNGPITLSLPPFRGVTRRIVLIALISFFALAVIKLFLRPLEAVLTGLIQLQPRLAAHGMIWQMLTYPFGPPGLISELFSLLSVWFFGSTLEDERGSRWLGEFFLVSTIGGGILASLLSYAVASRVPALDPSHATIGLWPFVLALLLAFARFHGDSELRVYFVIPIKAKFLAAIYVLFYLATSLIGGDQFGAMTAICVALSAYLYLTLAPNRGVRVAGSERWYSLRNAYYRAKRRRAAKKFTVYMKKQGKEVNIDADGRYVDPTGTPRDPNDKRWMN
jgi:membrane associated rhomboid family serine protease